MRDGNECQAARPLQGLNDLQALTLYGGGDRDRNAWKRLLAEAGLTLDRIQAADPRYQWVIARAAEAGRERGSSEPAL